MLAGIGFGTYLFFAAWLVLAFAFYWFFVPETRGKTLEEMDAAFGSHSSQEDVQELARIQAEIGSTALLSRSVNEKFQGEEKDSSTHVEERTAY
jgi:hypothetical protein